MISMRRATGWSVAIIGILASLIAIYSFLSGCPSLSCLFPSRGTNLVIISRVANIRNSPDTTSPIIKSLTRGTVIQVLGTVKGEEYVGDTDWYHIQLDGKDGYVHSSLAGQTLTTNVQSDCRLFNLLSCSNPVPIFFEGQSSLTASIVSGSLQVDFNNQQNWSSIALVFGRPIDVRGFNHVIINANSEKTFDFRLEYKKKEDGQVKIVQYVDSKSLPSTPINITINYDGTVDEIAFSFYVLGQSSRFVINSIRLTS